MTAPSTLNRFRPVWWFGMLLLLILGVEHLVTTSPLFAQRPVLPMAVTFDLLVGVPLLFYFLVVRRCQLPLSSLIGVVGACLAIAFWLIPPAQQQPLRVLQFLPVVLELGTLALLMIKAHRLVQYYQLAYHQEPQFWPCAQLAIQQTLGPAGVLLVAEMEMLRYALFGWWDSPESKPTATVFSNYRESGFMAFVIMFGAALAIETTVVHLLAIQWSTRVANWLLFFDAYSLLMLLAHVHAVRLRPVLLTLSTLHLRVGFVWQLTVARAEVVAIETLRDNPTPADDLLNLTKLLFTPPNLLLTFAHPVVVQGPYRIRRTVRRAAIYLDQPQQFLKVMSLPAKPV